ncbi:MAG: ABC transporter ATP-binding protein [Alphaproteobacteria bacterium]|nr:ABC transporter ATP-binding protein [Alphaproteobacteria bacterium]
MSVPILSAREVNKTFGAVVAARDINVDVAEGEVVGVIGANGAGKTTFVNMVTGYLKPSAGRIQFEGADITALPPRAIIRRGIGRSFQIPQVWGSMTVAENVEVTLGIAAPGPLPFWRKLDRPEMRARADAVLARFGIAEHAEVEARLLSQGVRKLLDVALATVRQPRLLLLDEPTSGISADEKFGVMETLMNALKDQQVTVLFVEHDMQIVERYATRVLAFYDGTIIADGAPSKVLADADVRRHVIGETHRPGKH